MLIADFETELQAIHKDFSIKKSKVAGLARVVFQGVELFSIPDENIYDNPNEQYGVTTLEGRDIPHRTRLQALGMAKTIAERMLKDKDYSDAMKGTGEYSDKELAIGGFKETVKVDIQPLGEADEKLLS